MVVTMDVGLDSLESNDIVTGLDASHTLTNGFDDTGTFVTQDNGECAFGVLSGECIRV